MFKKNLILFLIFYLLILLQTSLLFPLRISLNLILIFLFLIIFFEKPSKGLSLSGAIFGGFFLDLFSKEPFGTSILILFLDTLFVKQILKNLKEPNIFFFCLLFLAFLFFYRLSISIFEYLFQDVSFSIFDSLNLFQIVFDLSFAIFGFYCLPKLYARVLSLKTS